MAPSYRAEIDGLRALSVIGVVVFHAELDLHGFRLLPGGYLGVDVFLVISGYLITSILLRERDSSGTFSIYNFYMRRIRRIIPALYLVLAVSTISAVSILPPDSLIEYSRSALAAIFFFSNIYFWLAQDYFSETAGLSSLLHLWSLSVEEQFYLFYPLLLLVASRRRGFAPGTIIVLAGLISLFSAIIFQRSHPSAVFQLPNFRAWELLAGAAVAVARRSETRMCHPFCKEVLSVLGCVIILVSFLFGYPQGISGYAFNVLSVSGACLMIAFGDQSNGIRRTMASRPLVGIGLISYSLYLWHQPVFAFARAYALNDLSMVTKVVLILSTVLLAVLSWRLVEQPIRQPGVFGGRSILAMWSGGTIALAAICGLFLLHKGLPERYSADQQAMLGVSAERGTLTIAGQNCETSSLEKVCKIGASKVTPTWALLGDSHAETLSDALSQFLDEREIAAEVLTYPGCPFVLGVDPVYTTEKCSEFASKALDRLTRDKIKTVVINDRINAYMEGTRFNNREGGVEPGNPIPVKVKGSNARNESVRIEGVRHALSQTIETLLDRGIAVIYIVPVPEVGWNTPHAVVKLLATGGLPLTTSKAVYLQRIEKISQVLKAFDTRRNFLRIHPGEVFCASGERCITHTKTRLLYTDTDHLSREGASMLVNYLAERLQESNLIGQDR